MKLQPHSPDCPRLRKPTIRAEEVRGCPECVLVARRKLRKARGRRKNRLGMSWPEYREWQRERASL